MTKELAPLATKPTSLIGQVGTDNNIDVRGGTHRPDYSVQDIKKMPILAQSPNLPQAKSCTSLVGSKAILSPGLNQDEFLASDPQTQTTASRSTQETKASGREKYTCSYTPQGRDDVLSPDSGD